MSKPVSGNRATLREVAEEAGVSIAAVSKVLNGRGSNIRVSDERAESIRSAAKKLRYSPNVLASSLRMSRTQTIGLIWDRMQNIADGPLYYVYLLDGVARVLFKHHYRLTILPEIPEVDPVRNISDGLLDGAIWCKLPSDPRFIDELAHSGFKVVGLNSPPAPNGEYVSVTCDNEHGAELVVDHLVELGHKRILFVLDDGWHTTPDAVARLEGFKQALAKHGIECMEKDVVVWRVRQPDVVTWYESGPPHTAIFAWHDGVAASILSSAEAAGISIPEQLSVVGFDSTNYCESVRPRLTSVRQPIVEMAEKAAHLLIDLIDGKAPKESTYLFGCTLDIRNSTTVPAPRPGANSHSRGLKS